MLRDMEKKDIFFVQIVWHKEVIQPLYCVITLQNSFGLLIFTNIYF